MREGWSRRGCLTLKHGQWTSHVNTSKQTLGYSYHKELEQFPDAEFYWYRPLKLEA